MTLGPAKRQVQTGDLAKTKQQLTKAEDDARAKDEQVDSLRQQVAGLEDAVRDKDETTSQLQQELRAKDAELAAVREELARIKERAVEAKAFSALAPAPK